MSDAKFFQRGTRCTHFPPRIATCCENETIVLVARDMQVNACSSSPSIHTLDELIQNTTI